MKKNHTKTSGSPIFLLLKITIIVLPVILFGWLFEKNFALSGTRTITYDFSKDNTRISRLEPWQRLEPITKNGGVFQQTLKDETVYFSTPKDISFETVTIEIIYQSTNIPVLDIGLRINSKDGYKKLPLESELIDSLDWNHINEKEGTLYQKNTNFTSLNTFFESASPESTVLVHNFDIAQFDEKNQIRKENITPLRYYSSAENFDYILTRYKTPEKINLKKSEEKWKIARNTFNFGEAYIDEEGQARFAIIAPGLKELDGTLTITEIKLVFEKEAITPRKIIMKLKEFFNV